MSVQKILAQAEKLLQKGKLQEATTKLEEVLRTDPNNEVAANKLAIAYIDLGERSKAVGLYCQIAKRASDIGKSNKAIALYKQALNVDPRDFRVLSGLADESEQLGKFSEAKQFTSQLINFLLPRKRYLEATESCARLVRCSPNDEGPKIQWLEILRLLSDDSRLTPALVALCGPPGMVTEDLSIGGDPNELSDVVIEKLEDLLQWYPANPFLSYALGWVYYKRKNYLRTLQFIKESIRLDPDFTLSMLLYTRVLIDLEKLTESQFVYAYAKENMPKDRRTEIKILNEQVLAFEKSNGWMAISEDLGEEADISPENFLRLIRNEEMVEDSQNTGAYNAGTGTYNTEASRSYQINEPVTDEPPEQEFEATSMIQFNEIDLGGGGDGATDDAADQASQESADPVVAPPTSVAPPEVPVETQEEVEFTTFVSMDRAEAAQAESEDEPRGAGYGPEGGLTFESIPHEETDDSGEHEADTSATATKVYSPQDAVAAKKWGKAIRVSISDAEAEGAKKAKDAIEGQKRRNEELRSQGVDPRESEEVDSDAETLMTDTSGIPSPPPPPPLPKSPKLDVTGFIQAPPDPPESAEASELESDTLATAKRPRLGFLNNLFGKSDKKTDGSEQLNEEMPQSEIPTVSPSAPPQSLEVDPRDNWEDDQATIVVRPSEIPTMSPPAPPISPPPATTDSTTPEADGWGDDEPTVMVRPGQLPAETQDEPTSPIQPPLEIPKAPEVSADPRDNWEDDQPTVMVRPGEQLDSSSDGGEESPVVPPDLPSSSSQKPIWDTENLNIESEQPIQMDNSRRQPTSAVEIENREEREIKEEHTVEGVDPNSPLTLDRGKNFVADRDQGFGDDQPTMIVKPLPAIPTSPAISPPEGQISSGEGSEWDDDQPTIVSKISRKELIEQSPVQMDSEQQEIPKSDAERFHENLEMQIPSQIDSIKLESNVDTSESNDRTQKIQRGRDEFSMNLGADLADSGLELDGKQEKSREVLEYDSPEELGVEDKNIAIQKEFEVPEAGKTTIGMEGIEGEEPSSIMPFQMDEAEIKARLDAKANEFIQGGSDNDAPISALDQEVLDQILAKHKEQALKETIMTPEEKAKADIAAEIGETSPEAGPSDLILKDLPKGPIALREEQTKHFLEDVEEMTPSDVEFFNLAKKYYKERKYYLARKACRESMRAGGDEEKIKELLRKIRKKEFPDSMYAHFSTDDLTPPSGETVKDIIEKLDIDFDLELENDEEAIKSDIKDSLIHMRPQINQVLGDASPEVRMDLGIAFFEMGLFEEAEHIFENTLDQTGSPNLDALYLAAESMAQRGDYVSAVTILHKICKSPKREDSENLAVYYLLGEAYEAMNQKKRSLRYYKKAAEIDLNYRDLKGKLE